MRHGHASKNTLNMLLVDVEQHGRAQPRVLRELIYDVYKAGMLKGQPVGTKFWVYVGTDGYTVARLLTGKVQTVQRLDIPRYVEAWPNGGPVWSLIEKALKDLHVRHAFRVPIVQKRDWFAPVRSVRTNNEVRVVA